MNERKPFASSVSFLFSVFMLLIYTMLAVVIVVFRWPPDLPDTNRFILAAALLLYVIYRGYRLMKKRKEERLADGN